MLDTLTWSLLNGGRSRRAEISAEQVAAAAAGVESGRPRSVAGSGKVSLHAPNPLTHREEIDKKEKKDKKEKEKKEKEREKAKEKEKEKDKDKDKEKDKKGKKDKKDKVLTKARICDS